MEQAEGKNKNYKGMRERGMQDGEHTRKGEHRMKKARQKENKVYARR